MSRLIQDSCQYNRFKLPKIQMQELPNTPPKSNGRWTHEEHLAFLEGLRLYGKNWRKIEQLLKTRTGSQIRSHAQKFFLKTKPAAHDDPNTLSLSNGTNLQEEHQEATDNSKMSSESPSENQDSYFLSKIMEYSNSRQCLDFWEGLVDCKEERIFKSPQVRRSNSFISYQLGNKETIHQFPSASILA